ncbi:MAG: thioesterase family protein [Rhodocyclaceae bacterium]|nr:thioesterase family protein [Rhodocyclaceae bacterium]
MARVAIELPDDFPFSTRLSLYLSHINYVGHLDNALLLTLVTEARARFFASLGFTEQNVDGVGIVVADAALQYRSEAHHGEIMDVSMTATDFWHKGCDLLWKMEELDSRRLVAQGKTGIVFFDYDERASVPVPAVFRSRFD